MDQDLLNFLRANQSSSFYGSLLAQYNAKGYLSDRQVDCVRRGLDKANTPRVEVVADLSAIHTMFDTARSNGLKRLAYRAEGLVIKPAAATGKNPGALYVMDANTETYYGKVFEGKFSPSRDGGQVVGAVQTIARDPLEAARLYGRQTGSCSCCGRELTDPVSLKRSIGPVCEAKWFGGSR